MGRVFGLQVAVYPQGKPGKEFRAETGAKSMEGSCYWLVAPGFTQLLLYQSAIKKRPIDVLTGQSDGGDSSTEAHSSQVTLVCANMTKTNPHGTQTLNDREKFFGRGESIVSILRNHVSSAQCDKGVMGRQLLQYGSQVIPWRNCKDSVLG